MKKIIHGTSLVIFSFIFAKAGIYKVIMEQGMVNNMKLIGFDLVWTQFIGWAETILAFSCLLGLFTKNYLSNISTLLLWPFAIGALAVHFSYHHPFSIFWQSLVVCTLPTAILYTSERFSLKL